MLIAAQRGVTGDHLTLHRWVQRPTPELCLLPNTSIGFDHGRAAPSLSIGGTLAVIDEDIDRLMARADPAVPSVGASSPNRRARAERHDRHGSSFELSSAP